METLPKAYAINSHERPSQPFFVIFCDVVQRKSGNHFSVRSTSPHWHVGGAWEAEVSPLAAASKHRLSLQPKGDIKGK